MVSYLDCAATTPIDPRVKERVLEVMGEDFANSASRHAHGYRARQAVEAARDQIAQALQTRRSEVVFTSGATEANNLAILRLKQYGQEQHRRHIIISAIEHKAVLEPAALLAQAGFEIELLPVTPGGWVEPTTLAKAIRPKETLLVSIMQVNNETGIEQPIKELAEALVDPSPFFHVDAAQGIGKANLQGLRHHRVDLISMSGHKIHAPQGIGALITRRRQGRPLPLKPLWVGGGQERGLRPGTLPAALIAGLGLATELAITEQETRARSCRKLRTAILEGLAPLQPKLHGDQQRCLPNIANLMIPGFDSETLLELWSEDIAFSNGAACSSQDYTCSHVLAAMNLPAASIEGAIRLSWCHASSSPNLDRLVERTREIPL